MKMPRPVRPPKPLPMATTQLMLAVMAACLIALVVLLAHEGRLLALAVLFILLTSTWAAVDSVHIDLQAYKTWIALHPMILFNAMYVLWFVMFPWYLVVRSRIKAGTVPKRQTGLGISSRKRRR